MGTISLFGSDIRLSYSNSNNSVWKLDLNVVQLQLSRSSGLLLEFLSEECEIIDGILSMNTMIAGEGRDISAGHSWKEIFRN